MCESDQARFFAAGSRSHIIRGAMNALATAIDLNPISYTHSKGDL